MAENEKLPVQFFLPPEEKKKLDIALIELGEKKQSYFEKVAKKTFLEPKKTQKFFKS